MKFLRKTGRYYGFLLFLLAAWNFYLFFLVDGIEKEHLYYLDFLSALCFLGVFLTDLFRFSRKERQKRELLQDSHPVYQEIENLEDAEIAAHDVLVLQNQLETAFEENRELQDYVARWCHELKLPLSAAFLINESMSDPACKQGMREPLERMNRQVNSLLLGCRLQGELFDLQAKPVSLKECVATAIKNNQFFLIQKKFEIVSRVGEDIVYTDGAWIVYALDQLISNAVKYAKEAPRLSLWSEKHPKTVQLFIKDYGEGILPSDLKYIFEKGYTGRNYHNGKYKSTGMGLYMAQKILKKLGHEISVESSYGEYTQFTITFLTGM